MAFAPTVFACVLELICVENPGDTDMPRWSSCNLTRESELVDGSGR